MSTVETPVAHIESANTFMTQLRALMQSISGFSHISSEQRRRLIPPAAVPDRFLLTVAAALDASSVLANAAQITGPELRDAINFTNAFESVATELELAARGLRETITTRRADAGGRALRAYRMSKSLDRPNERSVLIPHIRDMKRSLGRGRQRSTAEEPPVETPPEAPVPPAVEA